jgi:hypothetical protein
MVMPSNCEFQLPLLPSFGSQTGLTSHGLTMVRLRTMTFCTLVIEMLAFTSFVSLLMPIRVVLLPSLILLRVDWSLVLVNGPPLSDDAISMVPYSLMILALLPCALSAASICDGVFTR